MSYVPGGGLPPPAPASGFDAFRLRHGSRIANVKRMAYLFRQSPLALIGLAIILFVFAIALFTPLLAIENPALDFRGNENWRINFPNRLLAPGDVDEEGVRHPFGTTESGNDLLSMVMYGTRTSLRIGFAVVLAALAIGVVLGAVAGYFGGIVDEVIMRVTDVFLSIPSLVLAMAVVAALGQGLDNVMYALVVTWWPAYTRLIRGSVLSVRENQYVEAARSVGASHARIIAKHVLPNAWSPVMVQATLDIGATILVAAALSFIGLGAPPGTAEWGLLVSKGRNFFPISWWYVVFPGLAILVTTLGFNLLGDGLRDMLDPKLRR